MGEAEEWAEGAVERGREAEETWASASPPPVTTGSSATQLESARAPASIESGASFFSLKGLFHEIEMGYYRCG
jgi:hypothetical protein